MISSLSVSIVVPLLNYVEKSDHYDVGKENQPDLSFVTATALGASYRKSVIFSVNYEEINHFNIFHPGVNLSRLCLWRGRISSLEEEWTQVSTNDVCLSFTGPKIIWTGPNILCQIKNRIVFSATPNFFVPALKLNVLNANHHLG